MNKILEAIQKGIQIGLEIQDDELDQPILQGSQITSDYHVDRVNRLRWVRENFVDLGLPSGTLWCKWNIGATNGSTIESWYGDYYAWGEIETKKKFDWKSYKYYDKSSSPLTKYADDDMTTLEPEDDVVVASLGKDFRMPAKEDIEELCSLPNKWVEDYDGIYGLNGRVFTGNNGNKLFIPAAGYRDGSDFIGAGSRCYLRSSSLYLPSPYYAYHLYFSSADIYPLNYYYRCSGFSVRGIL